jgi:hypothetical protein
MPSVHCAHIGPSGGGQCTDDVPFSTAAQDKVVPVMGFFDAPQIVAPLLTQGLAPYLPPGAKMP